jgi:hypothetical protein
LLLAIVAAGPLMALLSSPAGRVKTTPHAEKHSEAAEIRECLSRKGPVQVREQDDDPSVHVFCVELDPPGCGIFGIVIAQFWPSLVEGCRYRERTSFRPGDGTWDKVQRYLDGFSTPVD